MGWLSRDPTRAQSSNRVRIGLVCLTRSAERLTLGLKLDVQADELFGKIERAARGHLQQVLVHAHCDHLASIGRPAVDEHELPSGSP